MSNFVHRIIEDDFLWDTIIRSLPGKQRKSGTRFININCPMCVRRGERADRRMRCGVRHNAPGVGVHCFNCGFKTIWRPGELLSRPMQDFLDSLGVSAIEVKRLNHRAMTYRGMLTSTPETLALVPQTFVPNFVSNSLPPQAQSFARLADQGCADPNFLEVVEYLYSRGEEVSGATNYYWTPSTDHGLNRRVIIPLLFEDRVVGWTARAIDNGTTPKYFSDVPANYLFNNRVLGLRNRRYVILTEGVFDALAIDGVGMLGANLNPQQIAWIKGSGTTVILLPDRDKRGAQMIDVALHHGWRVAFPSLKSGHGNWWEPDVKDAAEAVKRYGRVWTLMSIIETSTADKIEINVKRKLMF